jgi:hypothetical protein
VDGAGEAGPGEAAIAEREPVKPESRVKRYLTIAGVALAVNNWLGKPEFAEVWFFPIAFYRCSSLLPRYYSIIASPQRASM